MKKIVIIGSGAAGCQVAKVLQNFCEVEVYSKKKRSQSNSMLAQGGISVALASGDSWQAHYKDTLVAGNYHNNPETTEILTKNGPRVVADLIADGMAFDQTLAGDFQYGLEGAHSKPRILHVHGDQTGKYLTEFLQQQLTQVTWKEDCQVVEIVTDGTQCVGIRYLQQQVLKETFADAVVLATGGIGGLYPLSSNASVITGDGLALAARAGVELADMEFVQFHPTLLYKDEKCYGLISEAVRGAGAHLVDEDGRRLLAAEPLADLAPRDVVARVLAAAYQAGHQVYLDISEVKNFTKRFPKISANLKQQGIPYTEGQLIPVHPGAHFLMGGIQVNANGETSLKNLYSVGEAACTGVHGANRLASNSLLECLVFGERVGAAVLAAPAASIGTVYQEKVAQNFHLPPRKELQERAWQALGIQREGETLRLFKEWLAPFRYRFLPADFAPEDLETANLCLIAETICQASLGRKKSLGAHERRN